MDRSHPGMWARAELAGLLEEYFGEKLTPPRLEELTEQVAAGLADRGRLELDS